MTIRTATHLDRKAIYRVHWSAFAEEERAVVAQLAVDLLLEETSPKTISLVAELEGMVVGHVAFSPVTIEGDQDFVGFVLTPLGVVPDYQKQRVGTTLVESGMQLLSNMGTDVLFVYGSPKYYSRFGFSAEAAMPYVVPYQLQYPYGWQAVALSDYKVIKTTVNLAFSPSLSSPTLW